MEGAWCLVITPQNTIQVVGPNSVAIPTSNNNPGIHSFRWKTDAATVISHSVAMVSYGSNCFLCIFSPLDPHEMGTLNLQNKRGASNTQSLNSLLSWSWKYLLQVFTAPDQGVAAETPKDVEEIWPGLGLFLPNEDVKRQSQVGGG